MIYSFSSFNKGHTTPLRDEAVHSNKRFSVPSIYDENDLRVAQPVTNIGSYDA